MSLKKTWSRLGQYKAHAEDLCFGPEWEAMLALRTNAAVLLATKAAWAAMPPGTLKTQALEFVSVAWESVAAEDPAHSAGEAVCGALLDLMAVAVAAISGVDQLSLIIERAVLIATLDRLLEWEPLYCPCGNDECNDPKRAWDAARSVLKSIRMVDAGGNNAVQ